MGVTTSQNLRKDRINMVARTFAKAYINGIVIDRPKLIQQAILEWVMPERGVKELIKAGMFLWETNETELIEWEPNETELIERMTKIINALDI